MPSAPQPRPRDLPRPSTAYGRAGLAALLADPATALLASDYDGTLAPIVEDPSRAFPQAGAVEVLSRLAGLVGGVALVTGRPAATAVALGGLDAVPGLVVLGGYGAQRWQAGMLSERAGAPPGPVPPAARAAVDSVVRDAGAAGIRVEDKGPAVAVHVRECADPHAVLVRLLRPLTGVAEAYGLAVEPGRLVVELRPPGTDKGAALRALVAESGVRTVVFVGDDLGDLAAFAAVDAVRRDEGLSGLTVASASAEAPEVGAAADLVVDGPPGVVALLTALADVLEGQVHGPGR